MTVSMVNKVCLVTGGTRGLGQATALKLVELGAHVIVVARSRTRIDDTLGMLRAAAERSGAGSAEGIQADLSSMAEVRQAAKQVLKRCDRLDVLVNNVGAALMKHQTSPDGYEMTWALNYLGHFLLTYELMGLLKATAVRSGEARVVEVTSSMCRYASPSFKRFQRSRWYNGVAAYAQSKLAMNMFAAELSRRLMNTGVTVNSITPGYVRTDISDNSSGVFSLAFRVVNMFSMDLEEGVAPLIWMATEPELSGVSGRYYYRFKQREAKPGWTDPSNVANLWRISEQMTGLA